MRRRLYFLLPDVKRAHELFRELLLARIDDRHIHFLAKEGLALGDLPEATLLQRSDAVHGLGVGLVVGGATGALAGVVALIFPPSGLVMGLGVILITSLTGAIMGIWVSGMIASDVPNTHLAPFTADLARGKVLAIVDVPKETMDELTGHIRKHLPRVEMRGHDPTIPAFP